MPRKKESELLPTEIQTETPTETSTQEPEIESLSSLDIQFHLPLEEQKKLISVPASATISNEMYLTAVKLAMSARVPLWGINIIPTKNGPKPYINADGIKFRLANDPRHIQSNKFKLLSMPGKMGDVAIVQRVITMGNGQVYYGLGAVKVDSQWNEANALLKADTKANRRAGYEAIADAVGMPMYDEDSERANGNTIESTYRVVPSGAPSTLSQLLVWIQGQKLTDEEVRTVTGIDFSETIPLQRDIPEMYKKLVDYANTKETVTE